jgi:hypothetical protein
LAVVPNKKLIKLDKNIFFNALYNIIKQKKSTAAPNIAGRLYTKKYLGNLLI